MDEIRQIIEKLESKKKDSISFQKKYSSRNMTDLQKYYEGAEWAFTFCISILSDMKNG